MKHVSRGAQTARGDRGIAALIVILLISGIIVEIGIAGLFIMYFVSQGGFGAELSNEAFAAAYAGTEDGILRVVRNYAFSSPSGYALSVSSRSAVITVCRGFKTVTTACDTALPTMAKTEITSLGSALSKRRELRAMLNVDQITGAVNVESIKEITL